MYHYRVSKDAWAYSEEKFNAFKSWARETQENFWQNFGGFPHIFSFWADPEDVVDYLKDEGMQASNAGMNIHVGYNAKPETPRGK